MARDIAGSIGREVLLHRANLGLTRRAAARLAGVSPVTYQRIEDGDPSVRIATLCRVADAIGLKVWVKTFPVREPRLRDTGQLRLAELLRDMAHTSLRFVTELLVAEGIGRSIDVVLFGATEIIAIEIIRQLADFQAQYRAAQVKRDELAARHQRPVRLVLLVEDSGRNRAVVREHAQLITTALPAGSRAVFGAIRSGTPLGRDGIAWMRPMPTSGRSAGG